MSVMKFTSVCLLLVTSFFGLFSFTNSNPAGFLNIDCGAIDTVRVDDQQWISDSPFVKTRNVSKINSPERVLKFQFLSFAYFPNLAAKKYCYLLPANPGQNYLVRASFSPDSITPLARFFDLVIEGIKWRNINLSDLDDKHYHDYEIILAAKNQNLSLCLARNSQTEENHFLFISAIELRPLDSSMYNSTDLQKHALDRVFRHNFGSENDFLRYPDDPFDRIWRNYVSRSIPGYSAVDIAAESYEKKSLESQLVNKPPVDVLMTAAAMKILDNMTIPFSFPNFSDTGLYHFALYFCNINQTSFTQIFAAFINENQISSYLELKFLKCWQADKDLPLGPSDDINISLRQSPQSELGPFINAAEMYRVLDLQTTTYSGDVIAIRKIGEAINFPDDWTGGDPCLPANNSSTGITCSQDNPPRVIIINLTNLRLEGTIPTNVANLTALTELLLGNTSLSGPIPDLSSLKNLTKLQLQNNQLTGEIPVSLEKLPMLSQLFLQDNKLNGTVPKGLVRRGLELRVDPKNHIPANSRKTKGWVIGLCSIVLFFVVLCVILLCRHKRRSQPRPIPADENNQNDYQRQVVEYTVEDIRTFKGPVPKTLGVGTFGTVYHCKLSECEVAVKELSTDSNQGERELPNEVTILSRIHHRHLVNLIGYCRIPKMTLVYEYMPSGSLADHLYGEAKLKTPLDWRTRLNIARQAADGLLYLHEGCSHPIIHTDIKSSNILLDISKNAKLSDIGISRLVESINGSTSTKVKRPKDYLDPEYSPTSPLNEKSDVYSFGVVLLEIISGKSPKNGIVKTATDLLWGGKNIEELVDSSFCRRYNVGSVNRVTRIACRSVEKESKKRPKMSEVVKELQEAVELANDDNNYSASPTMAPLNTGDRPNF